MVFLFLNLFNRLSNFLSAREIQVKILIGIPEKNAILSIVQTIRHPVHNYEEKIFPANPLLSFVFPKKGASTCPQQQLRDLREQYARLQEDYKNKLTEVSCMRTEMDKMKQEAREAKEERERAESRLCEVQQRMKMVQNDKSRFHGQLFHLF